MKRRNFLKLICASPLAGLVKADETFSQKELDPDPDIEKIVESFNKRKFDVSRARSYIVEWNSDKWSI